MGQDISLARQTRPPEASRKGSRRPISGIFLTLLCIYLPLILCLQKGVEVIVNARKEAGLINPETGYPFELDIFAPSLHLAFEFQVSYSSLSFLLLYILAAAHAVVCLQERHHYTTVDRYATRTLESVQKRDEAKKEAATQKGITLVVVPCWWDYRIER